MLLEANKIYRRKVPGKQAFIMNEAEFDLYGFDDGSNTAPAAQGSMTLQEENTAVAPGVRKLDVLPRFISPSADCYLIDGLGTTAEIYEEVV